MNFAGEKSYLVLSSTSTVAEAAGYDLLHLNQWEQGVFTTFLKSPLKWDSSVRYIMNLREISLDFCVRNLTEKDCLFYTNPVLGQWHTCYMSKAGHFSTILAILAEITHSMPAEVQKHIQFEVNEDVNRVGVYCSNDFEIKFNSNLASMLGFSGAPQTYSESYSIADRPADPFSAFSYIHLLCPTLCDVSYVSGEYLPLLRSIPITTSTMLHTTRLNVSFNQTHYVPIRLSSFSSIHFQFVRADDVTEPVSFLSNSGSCILSLDLKRDLLQFPSAY